MPIGRILEAELSSQVQQPILEEELSQRWQILTDNQVTAMVKFANRVPHFLSLPFDDQSYLLQEGMLLFVLILLLFIGFFFQTLLYREFNSNCESLIYVSQTFSILLLFV